MARNGNPTRRRQVMDAAAEEFAAKGYTLTSYGSIAERLGLQRTVVQNYISSKAELAAEIAWAPFRTGKFLGPDGELGEGIEGILGLVTHVAEHYVSDVWARASIRLMSERDVIPAELPIPFEGWLVAMERMLRDAVAAGELPSGTDVELVAHSLVATFEGSRRVAEARGRRARLPEYTRRTAECVLRGAS